MKNFKVYLLIFGLTLFLAVPVSLHSQTGLNADAESGPVNCNLSSYSDDLDPLLLIRDCYVDKIDKAVLDAAFQKGGLKEVFKFLDPHSRYLNESEKAEEEISQKEEYSFGGVGLEIKAFEEGIVIMGLIPNGPASRADIREEDVLIRVCQSDGDCFSTEYGKDFEWKSKVKLLAEAVKRIRGKIGTNVTIELKRGDAEVVVTLERAKISIENVSSKVFGEFIYVKLSHFSDFYADQRIFEEISKYPNAKGIVLDLRNNPGGYLTQANSVSSLFLERKKLITTIISPKDNGGRPQKFHAQLSAFRTNFKMPLVVLVNNNSASASEIVAAACQDYNRCVVVGMPTFGKALVQAIYDLGKERIYLTTARIYRPNGKSLQGKGVIPDIIVSGNDSGSIEKEMKSGEKRSEKSLEGYLRGEEEEFTLEENERFSLIKKDRQLEMGLRVLKILNLK